MDFNSLYLMDKKQIGLLKGWAKVSSQEWALKHVPIGLFGYP